ncbi:MAG: histidine kinase [Leeuwenhoekiella sp.]
MSKKLDEFLTHNSSSTYTITYKHHIIFWIIYFIFTALRWGSYFHDYSYSLKTTLIGFPIHIVLCYFNIYYLMPKFIFKQKYVAYTISILLSLFVMLLVKFNLTYYLVSTSVWPEGPEEIHSLTIDYAVEMMLGEFYVISFVTAIKITTDWLNEHNKLHDSEKRQLATELKFLRSQVSPHFFFNTLNNIYSLALEKSDKTPEIVLKLSEMMRYSLYATKKNRQQLTREIDCIQNYIELERIRFDDSLHLEFNISGDLDNHTIAPMLLIPLVENCFKHGASKSINEICIKIDVNVSNEFLTFKISNTIPNYINNTNDEEHGGIGLSNVQKRLELGYKKEDYNLSIFEKNNIFNVILKLKV